MSRIDAFVLITSSRGAAAARPAISRRVEQLIVVDALPHEPDALGLFTVEHLAEHDGGEHGLRAGDAMEHPRVATAGVQPELQEARVELRAPRRDAHVAHEREVHARADGGAVDRGQRREGERPTRRKPS